MTNVKTISVSKEALVIIDRLKRQKKNVSKIISDLLIKEYGNK